METVFNDPLISKFFQTISHKDRGSTLRELVLLGISVVNSKIINKTDDKENNPEFGCSNHLNLVAEIEEMKEKI